MFTKCCSNSFSPRHHGLQSILCASSIRSKSTPEKGTSGEKGKDSFQDKDKILKRPTATEKWRVGGTEHVNIDDRTARRLDTVTSRRDARHQYYIILLSGDRLDIFEDSHVDVIIENLHQRYQKSVIRFNFPICNCITRRKGICATLRFLQRKRDLKTTIPILDRTYSLTKIMSRTSVRRDLLLRFVIQSLARGFWLRRFCAAND